MSEGPEVGCAVCGSRSPAGAGMSRVVVEGRMLALCRTHAAAVVAEMPATFDDLRALFVGAGVDLAARAGERRSPLDRRDHQDRRVFPPRPEGRRMNGGRRAGDPSW